ncbi:hypothetical protein [Arthrobacter rhombi]|uniref:hypothetical protein n=1 Tax=Arthrobacter rhombi TaxID=71253 RepID=UPI003FD53C3A
MTENEATERRMRPTSTEIIAALRDAGWLLEQDTAATLEKSGFQVATAKAFPDPDDPSVSREIDVHAYRQIFRSDELSLSVGIRVLAECKQSTMPYVVVGAPASSYELGRPRQEQHFRFPSIETGRTELDDGRARLHHTQAREYLGLDTLPGNPWEGGFIGSQMTRLDRKKTWLADNRGIFTSLIYPLAKALTYFRSQSNRSSRVMHKPGQEWASVDFYYPLVVTSAPLFTVDTNKSTIEAVESPWATMTREIKSATIDGKFNIDIVTSDALEDYLDRRVNTFASAVAVLAENAPERFVTHQDHTYKQKES